MATTTNYGWTTPDDTALVKDGASAIRSLGTSIDTTTKNLNPSTTLGDIEYRSSTANTNTRLAIGTTGQILTVSGGVPVWAAPAGGGKVLQVVAATTTTETATGSSTYIDSTLTATITPSSASSKVLVLVSQCGIERRNDTSDGGKIRLRRGASDTIAEMSANLNYISSANTTLITSSYSISILDTPATTSATTYKTQFASASNDGRITMQYNNATSSIVLLEIGA